MRKIPDDLAQRIEVAAASDDPAAIVSEIRQGKESGAFGFHPTGRLLDSLMNFDTANFDPTDRQMIQELRLAVAHGLERYDIAGPIAETLLRENAARLSEGEKAALEMVVALDAMKRGRTETALHIWRKLLKPPTALDAPNRAWAWRNLALALPRDSAETRHASKCSADAFLEAGDKLEAGKSLMRLADSLMLDEPALGLQVLDEIIGLMEGTGLRGRQLRAGALHARGNRLARLGQHVDALRDAREAVELLRGLIGVEEQLISSLHLASSEAEILELPDTANACRREAENLTNEINTPRLRLTRRIFGLLEHFDDEVARDLLHEAELAGISEIVASVRVVQAMRDNTLSATQRLSLLEDTLQQLDREGVSEAIKQPAHLALAGELLRLGQSERAEAWYQRVLANDPFNQYARDILIRSLWRRERWGDAAIILRKQIDLRGAMPGLLYAYGRSLFEGGNPSGAVTALTQAIDNADLERTAREMRESALRSGGTWVPAPQGITAVAVTREDFEAALEQFARFISTEKRMRFWRKAEGSDHSWIDRPEQYVQDLLHTSLKTHFLERVTIFEEVASGAGRIDLYVQLFGGLSLIVELKMCEFGYSGAYAAAGEDQILHYMENRQSHLGYLVVIDARLDGFGQQLLSGTGHYTVVSKFIDVRPRISRRSRGRPPISA